MCNEREESIWYIKNDDKNDDKNDTDVGTNTSTDSDGCGYITVNDGAEWCTTLSASNMYTKQDHDDGGVGLNRKFDPSLVGAIDDIFSSKWDLPEYLPFRECVKMGIQDGIIAGRKIAADILGEKNRQIEEAKKDAERWQNAFKGLLLKCREGVEAFEFISKVVHLGSQAKEK